MTGEDEEKKVENLFWSHFVFLMTIILLSLVILLIVLFGYLILSWFNFFG